jgi:hypothetical protein
VGGLFTIGESIEWLKDMKLYGEKLMSMRQLQTPFTNNFNGDSVERTDLTRKCMRNTKDLFTVTIDAKN